MKKVLGFNNTSSDGVQFEEALGDHYKFCELPKKFLIHADFSLIKVIGSMMWEDVKIYTAEALYNETNLLFELDEDSLFRYENDVVSSGDYSLIVLKTSEVNSGLNELLEHNKWQGVPVPDNIKIVVVGNKDTLSDDILSRLYYLEDDFTLRFQDFDKDLLEIETQDITLSQKVQDEWPLIKDVIDPIQLAQMKFLSVIDSLQLREVPLDACIVCDSIEEYYTLKEHFGDGISISNCFKLPGVFSPVDSRLTCWHIEKSNVIFLASTCVDNDTLIDAQIDVISEDSMVVLPSKPSVTSSRAVFYQDGQWYLLYKKRTILIKGVRFYSSSDWYDTTITSLEVSREILKRKLYKQCVINGAFETETGVAKQLFDVVSQFLSDDKAWLIIEGGPGIGKDFVISEMLQVASPWCQDLYIHRITAGYDVSVVQAFCDCRVENPGKQVLLLVSELNLCSKEELMELNSIVLRDQRARVVGTQNSSLSCSGRFKVPMLESVKVEVSLDDGDIVKMMSMYFATTYPQVYQPFESRIEDLYASVKTLNFDRPITFRQYMFLIDQLVLMKDNINSSLIKLNIIKGVFGLYMNSDKFYLAFELDILLWVRDGFIRQDSLTTKGTLLEAPSKIETVEPLSYDMSCQPNTTCPSYWGSRTIFGNDLDWERFRVISQPSILSFDEVNSLTDESCELSISLVAESEGSLELAFLPSKNIVHAIKDEKGSDDVFEIPKEGLTVNISNGHHSKIYTQSEPIRKFSKVFDRYRHLKDSPYKSFDRYLQLSESEQRVLQTILLLHGYDDDDIRASICDILQIPQDSSQILIIDAVARMMNCFQESYLLCSSIGDGLTQNESLIVSSFMKQIGVCRHQSVLSEMLLKACGIPVETVTNSTHMFNIVILPNKEAVILDLNYFTPKMKHRILQYNDFSKRWDKLQTPHKKEVQEIWGFYQRMASSLDDDDYGDVYSEVEDLFKMLERKNAKRLEKINQKTDLPKSSVDSRDVSALVETTDRLLRIATEAQLSSGDILAYLTKQNKKINLRTFLDRRSHSNITEKGRQELIKGVALSLMTQLPSELVSTTTIVPLGKLMARPGLTITASDGQKYSLIKVTKPQAKTGLKISLHSFSDGDADFVLTEFGLIQKSLYRECRHPLLYLSADEIAVMNAVFRANGLDALTDN